MYRPSRSSSMQKMQLLLQTAPVRMWTRSSFDAIRSSMERSGEGAPRSAGAGRALNRSPAPVRAVAAMRAMAPVRAVASVRAVRAVAPVRAMRPMGAVRAVAPVRGVLREEDRPAVADGRMGLVGVAES